MSSGDGKPCAQDGEAGLICISRREGFFSGGTALTTGPAGATRGALEAVWQNRHHMRRDGAALRPDQPEVGTPGQADRDQSRLPLSCEDGAANDRARPEFGRAVQF